MREEKKQRLAQLRHWRVRRKLSGTKDRPRMSVKFSQQHIYVQFIDDSAGVTLAAASTRSKDLAGREQIAANVKGAERIGQVAAAAAKSQGITRVVFDRGSAKYHGKVKALADAARKAGLQF
jgi:large subunit ribosomal protein L18